MGHYSETALLFCQKTGFMDLQLWEHSIQIFADIFPTTVQKYSALKPLLQLLITNGIKYHWAFLFHLAFTCQHKKHSFSTFPDGEVLMKKLGLSSADPGGSPSPLATSHSLWKITSEPSLNRKLG